MKFRVLKGVLLVGMGVVLGSFAFSKGWAIPDGRNVPSLTYTPIIKVTDARDGQRYRTVEIGTQTWMAENLNYNYNEGTARSYCYDDDPANCEKYGRLYTWSAAMDSAAVFSESGKDCGYGPTCSVSGNVRGVCPEGWHLPSNEEWNTIANYGVPRIQQIIMERLRPMADLQQNETGLGRGLQEERAFGPLRQGLIRAESGMTSDGILSAFSLQNDIGREPFHGQQKL